MGRTILFPADLPPILMVPPQEHCQGERSSPQFQTQNSLWCATRPLAASFSWLVQSNRRAPSPKSPPACRGFCSVGNDNRNLREALQKMSLWFPCSSDLVATRGRDMPWQHNGTLNTGIYNPHWMQMAKEPLCPGFQRCCWHTLKH